MYLIEPKKAKTIYNNLQAKEIKVFKENRS